MDDSEFKIEYETLLNTLVDGVIIIDASGIMRLFNPACENIFGYSLEDVLGKNVTMLMPEPYHSEHDGYLARYSTTGQKRIIGIGREVEGRRKDGSTFPMDLSVGEINMREGAVFVGVIRDLTARNKQQQEFDQLKEQHNHLSRVSAMNQMGSAIAHEINQPMTASLNYIETAKMLIGQGRDLDIEKLSTVLDDAIAQTERATDIVARMRRFIRGGDMKRSANKVKDIVDASMKLVFLGMNTDEINVSFNISASLPPVLVDSVQIQQVIINIVKNACEAMMDSPEKTLNISAGLSECGDFVEIAISDTGLGLEPDDIKSLFVPFASAKQTGLGVGLSISQSIINHHSGQLWAHVNEPVGSVFHFTLPIAKENP